MIMGSVLATGASTAKAQVNLVTNPGFETGDFTGWTTIPASSGSDFDVSTSSPHTGTYSAALGATSNKLDFILQNLPTKPGRTYTLTFWLKSSSGTPAQFLASWNGGTIFNTANTAFPYQQEIFTSLPATGYLTTLEFGGLQNPSWYYLDDVSVTLNQMQYRSFALQSHLTPNQVAVATALDQIVGNSAVATLNNFMNNESLNSMPWDFDLIAPEEYTALFEAGFASSTVQNDNIANHLEDVRNSSNEETTVGLTVANVSIGSDGKTAIDAKDGKNFVAPAAQKRLSFFVAGGGEFTNVSGDFNSNGYDFTSEGMTVGLDYHVCDHFTAGIYLGYAHTFTDLVNGGTLDVNSGKGGVYATAYARGFYLNAIAGGGYTGYSARRTGLGGFALGDTNGNEFSALLGTGYDAHLGAWTFGPLASAQYTNVAIDGFVENGSLAPLHIGSQSEASLISQVGAHAVYTCKIGGATVHPEIRATWLHEYLDRSRAIGAEILGTSAGFVVQGPAVGRDSVVVSAGVTVDLSETTSISAGYQGQLGRENYDQHSVTGSLRVKF